MQNRMLLIEDDEELRQLLPLRCKLRGDEPPRLEPIRGLGSSYRSIAP